MRMTRQISEFGPSAGLSIITSQVHGFDHTVRECAGAVHGAAPLPIRATGVRGRNVTLFQNVTLQSFSHTNPNVTLYENT